VILTSTQAKGKVYKICITGVTPRPKTLWKRQMVVIRKYVFKQGQCNGSYKTGNANVNVAVNK